MNSLSRSFALGLAGVCLLASPAMSQDEPEPLPDFENLTEREAFDVFGEDTRRWISEPCDFGVPILGVMLGYQPDNVRVERAQQLAMAFCADIENRYADGLEHVREFNRLIPEEREVALELYFVAQLDDPDQTLGFLKDLEGEELRKLEKASFWSSVRKINLAGRSQDFEALALQWFDSGQIAFLDSDLWESLANTALAEAVRANRGDMTEQLLGYITTPVNYVELLTDREFEPIWPQIEARAGANLESIGEEHVRMTRRRLTNAPGDRDRFSDAAHALHFNGDFEQAIALAETWRDREERGLELEEGDGWALNIQAYAYDSLGKVDLADQVFDKLAAVDPDENYWVVSFVINRASRQIGQGRWEEGLEASDYARSVAEKSGTTYAKMIVAKDQICALNQLGRADETADDLTYLRDNRKESVQLLASGLLCLGLRDEAAETLIAAFDDEVMRDTAIWTMRQDEADLFYTQSMLPRPRDLMADYPELAAQYARYARDLPEEFIPRASILRAKLDLPEWE